MYSASLDKMKYTSHTQDKPCVCFYFFIMEKCNREKLYLFIIGRQNAIDYMIWKFLLRMHFCGAIFFSWWYMYVFSLLRLQLCITVLQKAVVV